MTITGSGTPIVVPHRAGPGVLVTTGDLALQFDTGRNTTNRLAEAGLDLRRLTAVFITHHHSDHLVGLADLAMSWWLEEQAPFSTAMLPVIAPTGPAADIAEHVLDVWHDEMKLRAGHVGRPGVASLDVRRFEPYREPGDVFSVGDVTVSAVSVRHEPVVPAVGYRVDTTAGSVAISGDTAVCPEMESLANGADVLVHEAFRSSALPDGLLSDPDRLAAYHADTRELGALAAGAGVGTLVLTHCIPPPQSEAEKAGFVKDIREGGFRGDVIVATDLDSVKVGA